MRVEFAFAVRQASQLVDGSWVLLGVGADIFNVPVLPATVPMGVFVRLASPHAETATLTGKILGPELVQLGELRVEVAMAAGDLAPEGWEITAHIPIQFLAPIEEYGVYSVELMVDGSSKSVPIIIRPSPPGSPPDLLGGEEDGGEEDG